MPRLAEGLTIFPLIAMMALALFGAPSLADEPATATATRRMGTAVVEFRLANGLQVVLIPDTRAPVVTHSIWYKVGATDDPPHSHGLAHFLEHMMFKGTDAYPAGVFNSIVSRIGGVQNAATSAEYTSYYQIVPKAHLAQMMEMEADRMVNLRMNESEVVSERTVILQERRGSIDDNYSRRLFIKAYEALYAGHPNNTDLIGSPEEILAFSRDDALAFYREHYAPGNAVLVVAGDVTEAELRQLAEKTYGRVPARTVSAERAVLRPLQPVTQHRVSITDPHLVTPGLFMIFRLPGLNQMELRESVALSVLAEILGSDTGRLRQKLVLSGIARDVVANFDTGFTGRFSLGANAAMNVDLARVETALAGSIAELLEKGVTQDELDLERADFLAGVIQQTDYQSLLATKYATALILNRNVEFIEQWLSEIKAVTVGDINAAARKYLVEDLKVTAEGWPATAASAPAPTAGEVK
jgi:zinc protease